MQHFSLGQPFFIQPPMLANSAFALVNGLCWFCFMPLFRQYRLLGLGTVLNAAGDASSTVRFGIYRNALNGLPSTLLVDAGPTNSGSGTNVPLLSNPFDLTLDAGGYWACIVAQNVTTQPQVTRVTSSAIPNVGQTVPDSVIYIGLSTPSITGALPGSLLSAPFTRQSQFIAIAPQVVTTST
jgi:hypothetical protein